MGTIIFLCGVHAASFAVFHLFFWKLFNWKAELPKMTVANRAIIQIFNVLGIFIFLFMAVVCFGFKETLQATTPGKIFLAFGAGFWLIRFILQFVYLRVNNWVVHSLSVLFFMGFLLFLLPIII